VSLKDTVGVKNPYRYRGYRYDTETGLYYLNSRYYNPEWGRFLNIDAIGGNIGALLSHNIFAYCSNNTITAKDPSGFRPVPAYVEETEATRKASYKAMNKYYASKSSSSSSSSSNFSYKGSATQGGISGAVDAVCGWSAGLFIKGEKVWKDLDYLTMGKYVTKYSKGATAAMKCIGVAGSVGMTVWNAKQSFDKGETFGGVVDIIGGAVGILAGVGIAAVVGATALTGLAAVAVGVVAGVLVGMVIDYVADEVKNYHYGR